MKKTLSILALISGISAAPTAMAMELVNGLEVISTRDCTTGIAAKDSGWKYYYCAVNNTEFEDLAGGVYQACIIFRGRGHGSGVVYIQAVAQGRSGIERCN